MSVEVSKAEKDDLTDLLGRWGTGTPADRERLLAAVQRELRRLAAAYMRRERPDHTLQPTALVNEAYLRLVHAPHVRWEGRAHFFGIAARLMRQILVDHARRHRSQKRGGGVPPVPLDQALAFAPEKSDDIVALDEALSALALVDERKCKVIELRFFGGFSVDETARALNVSVGTIGREQRLAEAWLHRALARST